MVGKNLAYNCKSALIAEVIPTNVFWDTTITPENLH